MKNFNLKVEKYYKRYLLAPAVVIAIGLLMFAIRGLNLGIDFLGGSIIQIELGQTFETSDIRAITDQFDENADITYAGENNTQVIITSRINFDDAAKQDLLSKFEAKYNLGDDALLSVDTTSASIGKDLQRQALLASVVAIICLLIYITLRFEFLFGVATIICLLHDLMIVLSVYAVFHIYVTSNFIAAMLTILGYSINATIVVFDRVREERKKMGKREYANVIDVSVKKSLKRTLYTMVTTLLTMISLYIFGVESIRNFLLPMMIGFICGTYSSLFVAGSIWYMIKKNTGVKKPVKAGNPRRIFNAGTDRRACAFNMIMEYKIIKQRHRNYYNEAFIAAIQRQFGLSELSAAYLASKGFSTLGQIEEYLHPKRQDFSDPYLFADMEKCVGRIEKAIREKEMIAVYGDYDCDGVCATVILYKALKSLHADVSITCRTASATAMGSACRR
jgi:preprotein translocase subunit SecF